MGSDLRFRKASYEPGVREFGNGCFAYLQPDGGWGYSNAGLVTDGGEQLLTAGMCAGFAAGEADGHHLVNRSTRDAVYLEVGDRLAGDAATYPDDDIVANAIAGGWQFSRKDGTPY